MTIADDVVAQAEQCLRNIESALTDAGCGLVDVVRVRYMLTDREGFERCWPLFEATAHRVRPGLGSQLDY